LVELGKKIETAANSRAIALATALRSRSGVTEAAPGFSSVTIHYDPGRTSFQTLERAVKRIVDKGLESARQGRLYRWPVVYDGPDLEAAAATLRLTVAEVIQIHSRPTYRCLLVGPLPGQACLGPLSEPLRLLDSGQLRIAVPPGSIAIGGGQTVIHSLPAAAGWRLIGRTSVPAFLTDGSPPSILQVGDRVRFFEVNKDPLPEFARRM
jgi:KipI family sensor histidine kinase inhibitor